jgi:hypothetical protein
MAESISPEERLFKAIQKGKRPEGQGNSANEKKPEGWFERSKKLLAPRRVSERTGADLKKALWARMKWPELEPAALNRALVVVLVVVLGFFLYAATAKRKDVAAIAKAVAKIKIVSEEGQKKIEPLKELSYYLDEVKRRDIFRPNEEAPVVEDIPESSESLTKAAEGLTLQGISWGDLPKAMIFWQKDKDSQMYFLVEGQAIGTTGLKVTKISKSSVKIGDGKEEMVLS